MGLTPQWVVADLGSGTGLSSKPFLDHGNAVMAVEPNPEMRGAAERLFGGHARFTSVSGTAEATGLADASTDLAVAGQAFHWFDEAATRDECRRVLREPRWAAVMWNVRETEADDFARGYEALLRRWGTDYTRYRARRIDPQEMGRFFGSVPTERRMPNEQVFDLEGLRGRHLSASYVPLPGHVDYEPMMQELSRLYELHAEGGLVRFGYNAQLFVGQIA